MYIIKVKGKAKIPDYIQVRDENFVLVAYFRADRPMKSVEKFGLEGKEEQLEDGSLRTVLAIPRCLAPVKLGILPLVKKDGLPELAMSIFNALRLDFTCQYDEKDAIGKRYRRQDAIGTPYCITIDHQSLDDGMVTLRDRDSMNQERIAINDLKLLLHERLDMSSLLQQLI